jgi:hypothetical protein
VSWGRFRERSGIGGVSTVSDQETQTSRLPWWWVLQRGMPAWALREHVWVIRALEGSGFAVIGYGAYLQRAGIIVAGIAAVAVGLLFWRMSGHTELAVDPQKGLTLTTDAPPLREERAVPIERGGPGPEPPQPR